MGPQYYRLSVTVHTLPREKRRRREKRKFLFSWKSANEAPIVGCKVINERGNLRLLLLWGQPASELSRRDADASLTKLKRDAVTSCTPWCEGIRGWIHKQGNLTSLLSFNTAISSPLSFNTLRLGTDILLFYLGKRDISNSNIIVDWYTTQYVYVNNKQINGQIKSA